MNVSSKALEYRHSVVFYIFTKIILISLKLKNKIYLHNSSEILNNPNESKLTEELK